MAIVELLKNIGFIKLYIVLCFILLLFLFNSKNKNHLLVVSIVSLSVFNEVLNYVLLANKFSVSFNSNIYTVIHNSTWLVILKAIFEKKKLGIILLLYLIFSFTTLLLTSYFIYNFLIFITGALLYCTLFIFLCYEKLLKEEFDFFTSNNFYLVFAPVMFFLGLSLIFGFQNTSLAQIKIFQNFSLYKFITYFVNIIYYTFINLYIYKEYKIRNE